MKLLTDTAPKGTRRSRAAGRAKKIANRAARRIRHAAQTWDAWAEAQVARWEEDQFETDQLHGLMVGGRA